MLDFLVRIKWLMIPLALFVMIAGVIMLVRHLGNPFGWILVVGGALQLVLQRYYAKHARETDAKNTIM